MPIQHTYTLNLQWNGNNADIRTYDRSFSVSSAGKTEISGSADASSKGDPKKWNPEELLLSSLASCHMLWYLYLCSQAKIIVTSYHDEPTGILSVDPHGKSHFLEATLQPKITLADSSRKEEALALQAQAHDKCYIVNSVNFEVKLNPSITS